MGCALSCFSKYWKTMSCSSRGYKAYLYACLLISFRETILDQLKTLQERHCKLVAGVRWRKKRGLM
jgi:hypothetical protein